ncbi:peroxiredoxin 5, isoform CRA_a [Rattus norvegicus]|uniref:thioredoxin-dependent peroxiredoxin n=1 Tax=Rattus norvegicus TaxID=10116 RepID=A6HZJ1_RAT|nr:peroxiredoxin 5, isoform CRA_a [Rattus norvegicus]
MVQLRFCVLGSIAGSVLRASATWTCVAGRAGRKGAGWECGGARSFSSAAVTMAPIKVGDTIPSVEVFEGEPGKKVNLAELFKDKKGVLFGVPGAFTPGCSKVRFLLLQNQKLEPGAWEKRTPINLIALIIAAGGSTVKITWETG